MTVPPRPTIFPKWFTLKSGTSIDNLTKAKKTDLQNKSKTTNTQNKATYPLSNEYNPLLGFNHTLPSRPEQGNQNDKESPIESLITYAMVSIPVIQKTVYSRPNPPSTILASQNFPPFPPDPGNSPQSTSP